MLAINKACLIMTPCVTSSDSEKGLSGECELMTQMRKRVIGRHHNLSSPEGDVYIQHPDAKNRSII